MLRIAQNSAFAPGASTSLAVSNAGKAIAPVLNHSTPARNSADDSFPSTGLSKHDLLAMNAGIDAASRKANALSTANDAIAVIGGLLNNIRGSLDAVAGGSASDADAEQSRIDGAIVTIDAIAGSTRFAGRTLLDGSFTVTGSGSTFTIPSFTSSALGASPNNDQSSSPSLSTLQTGGGHAIGTGRHTSARRIVTAALSQVGGTQSQITGLISAISTQGTGALPADSSNPSAAASSFGADPAAVSQATANSAAHRVLALLGP